MERTVYSFLKVWKDKPNGLRKPLILQGARQVGKTWLLETLGEREFDRKVVVNFEEQPMLRGLFEQDFDVDRIFAALRIASGQELIPGETLLVLDEIQEAPRGLLALKYLAQHAPQYHIAAAGSLLGISLHAHDSFPVGKVEFIRVEPLSFPEFLLSLGHRDLVGALEAGDMGLTELFRDRLISLLRLYYYVGGMPEAVAVFSQGGDLARVRQVQLDLLESYRNDFSKHPPLAQVPRIRMVWDSIPAQLARENKKFLYGSLKTGARAKDFELAIAWLQQAGAVRKVTRITQAALPVKGFEDPGAFKLYMVDVGLLGALCGLNAETLLEGNRVFSQYKGALTEQYVCQQLAHISEAQVHYWSPEAGTAEVDFVMQAAGRVIPIEVKAEENLRAKSLQVYCQKYAPQVAIRSSMSGFRREPTFTNLPLYALSSLLKVTDPGR